MFKELVDEILLEAPFLIMTHRGFWGGNIIQNSSRSAQLAYRAGSDIVEVDVCRSADGVYYLFHDGGELDLLGIDQPFWELESDVIDGISVLNSLGQPSGYRVERLSEFSAWLPEDALVNIDRSWNYWEDSAFFEILVSSGKSRNLLLKSPVEEAWLEQFNLNAGGLAYMPIAKSVEEFRRILAFEDLNLVGVELVPTSMDSDLLDRAFIQELQARGFFIMANAEKLGERFNLFAGLDDDLALLGSESGWQAFLDLGVNVIQTDWPNFLADFRESYVNEVYQDYQGKVDPLLLRPLLGQSYVGDPTFEKVVELLNQWQMRAALDELVKLEEHPETHVDALRLQAEVNFVYEEHAQLMEKVESILAIEDADLQALWLGAVSSVATGSARDAYHFLSRLEDFHPNWAEKLKELLAVIEAHSDYVSVVTDMDTVDALDVVAIYGYGLTEDGEVPAVLESRLRKGLELSADFPEAKVIVSGGAVSTPFNEAEAMGEYLMEHGIDASRIILEPLAKDTVGNSLMMTDIIREHGFQSCCVVTSITHLPRAFVSLVGALKAVGLSMELYGAANESQVIPLPENERRLNYSTLFRAANLYSKDDFESEVGNDVNI